MRTIIILLATIAIYSTAFINTKCEHVFAQVEQANVKIERPDLFHGGYYTIPDWPTGLQEGKELICVKCFHKQNQTLDYGPAEPQPITFNDSALTRSFACDTLVTWGSGGHIKFDTLWGK